MGRGWWRSLRRRVRRCGEAGVGLLRGAGRQDAGAGAAAAGRGGAGDGCERAAAGGADGAAGARRDAGEQVKTAEADAATLPAEQGEFDLILCDVPCSGTGTLARNPEIRQRL